MTQRGRSKRPLDLLTAGSLSFAGHVVSTLLLIGVVRLAQRSDPPAEPVLSVTVVEADGVEIELPALAHDSPLFGAKPQAPDAPQPHVGGERTARPDEPRPGRGGDESAREQAVNYDNRNDEFSRDTSIWSSLSPSQVPRIRAGKTRTSYEDARMSREPMELTFVAMGKRPNEAHERRPEALFNPARGLRSALAASALGHDVRGQRSEDGSLAQPVGAAHLGGPSAQPGAGTLQGSSQGPASIAQRNSLARPFVSPGAPSVPAEVAARPTDTIDTEQSVASRLQALIHASTRGGAAGSGRGGEGGGGSPGLGGDRGAGSKASPIGQGGAGSGDIVRMSYLRNASAKIYPHTASAFPKGAIADGLGGTVIVRLVIERDGSISSANVLRKSGIDEFDQNIRAAAKRGAPFGPLPEALGNRLVWDFSFVATNPAVRPKHAQNGLADR